MLDRRFGWRDLLPGAAICTVIAAALNTVSTFVLGRWFAWYGGAYGGFGIALALMSWVGILALFWMWIAAAQGVYWEHRDGAPDVDALEQDDDDVDAALIHPSGGDDRGAP